MGAGGPGGGALGAAVGGRDPEPGGQPCAGGVAGQAFPWLVPGFLSDATLGGDGFYLTRTERDAPETYDGKRERGFADRTRPDLPTLPPSERHAGFDEVTGCLSEEEAIAEAGRCLQCALERCPERFLR